MRAGQSPNCPEMSRQVLAPVLAQGAEPKRLWHRQPQAQLACHSNRTLILSIPQEAQDSEIPSRLSWGLREHRTRAQAGPALPPPHLGPLQGTTSWVEDAKTRVPGQTPDRKPGCCVSEAWRGHQVQSPASRQSSPQGTARAATVLPWVASA